MSQNEPHTTTTTDEIMDFLKEHMVTKQEFHEFRQEVDTRFGTLETRIDEKLGKLRSDIIDYMDKRLLDLKGDLVVIMKSEDRKLCALIELLVHKSILTTAEAKTIVKLEPFPQAV